MSATNPRVAVFAPDPLLTVAIEARPGGGDELHLHAGGQGVWVSRVAAALGGRPVLCGFVGGETGTVLEGLLRDVELRAVASGNATGAYVVDRRGERTVLAQAFDRPHTRHEADSLLSAMCAAALDADVAVVCNPYPGETLSPGLYGPLVTELRDAGTTVLVDLSTPRLDAALEGGPEYVKLNDWELAEYVCGPVDGPRMRDAAELILSRGAGTVIVTRGAAPLVAFTPDGALEVVPPAFRRGHREGCGDAMAGAMAVALARGEALADALTLGAAAGAANFLRRGLGNVERDVVDALRPHVLVRPYAGEPLAA